MSKSILCHKLIVRDLIEQLDQEGCVDVIRSLSHHFDAEMFQDWVTKMIFNLADTTTKSLIQIENTIKSVVHYS